MLLFASCFKKILAIWYLIIQNCSMSYFCTGFMYSLFSVFNIHTNLGSLQLNAYVLCPTYYIFLSSCCIKSCTFIFRICFCALFLKVLAMWKLLMVNESTSVSWKIKQIMCLAVQFTWKKKKKKAIFSYSKQRLLEFIFYVSTVQILVGLEK